MATSQGEVLTRVLVGADGVHSQVRKTLFPTKKVRAVPAIEALITPRPEVLEVLGSRAVIDFKCIEGGYGWIFPKADHFNVGLYRLYKTKNNIDLTKSLLHFIDSNPLLCNEKIENIRGFEIPIKAVSTELTVDNIILVGDAAGLGEAFYGEGIYFAVQSGCKAGEFIIENLHHGKPLKNYSKWVRILRRDMFISRITANLFYRMPDFGFNRMVRNPFVNKLFTGVVSGEVSPWQCLSKTALCLPYWIFKKRYSTTSLASMV